MFLKSVDDSGSVRFENIRFFQSEHFQASVRFENVDMFEYKVGWAVLARKGGSRTQNLPPSSEFPRATDAAAVIFGAAEVLANRAVFLTGSAHVLCAYLHLKKVLKISFEFSRLSVSNN